MKLEKLWHCKITVKYWMDCPVSTVREIIKIFMFMFYVSTRIGE